jgi:LacI family transcriptional regulator
MATGPERAERRPATVRLSDVARAAGVSLATASRVLNGSASRNVGASLRERVLAAADELRYVPDANAQAMARGRTATIGLVVHDITDPYFSAIAAGVTDAADEAGLAVTLASTGHDPEREIGFVQTLHNLRARAVILAGGRQDDPEVHARLRTALGAYQDGGGSVAVVGQPVDGVSTVRVDNAGATAELARALWGQGHRRFAVLTGPARHLTARERTDGFVAALAGLGAAAPVLVPCEFTRDGGYAGMRELLGRKEDVELVFAVTDVMAVGAMAAAREAGIAMPEQLAVAGVDDISTLRDVTPSLTTVRVPMRRMGVLATELALAEGPSRTVTVGGEVILRESTSRLSAAPARSRRRRA